MSRSVFKGIPYLITTEDAQHLPARTGFRPRPLGRNSAAAEASPCEAGEAR